MEELFRRLVEKGGCIVSSADCHQIEIADARVRGDWWVDENGMGFVLRLPGWLARHSQDARGANSDTCEIRARSGARAGDCTKCGGPVQHRDGKPGEYDHECRSGAKGVS